MSEDKKSDGDTKPAETAPAPAVLRKPSAAGGIFKILIPALLAAGASYGGTRYAKAQNAIVIVHEKEGGDDEKKHETHPPGPTISLEPFIFSVFDAQKKAHPMKMTVAVEFDAKASGHDEPKAFMPRIRDAVLTHLRRTPYEEMTEPTHVDKMRKELLEECKEVGAESAKKVLVTDFVIQ